ncbi:MULTISPECIES: flagellar biosynthetic protein FliR [Paenibacillus]|uniref:Flagellar biosynthetic protein FliR n=1 Tax=Paenibacillus naphthalenovorans TaxID=162209 RepID=A0A0U2UID0_9BACL|nr:MULTISPECIES: flagellar biosynthetic protein FliR [Paenibacillus]ALS21649.1 flagellar biosynthesis protein FliR [Paenibacillus naphthalenovorans]GCL71377.1 flagellar type III secretion system protein FliR [Paenibacillus naphthalenovorans]SDI87529.1 flagellar biosynthetic protein FliR [Paenibacillus naphthalenovorans]
MEWFLTYFPGFLLILCRVTSFFVVSPVFSAQHVPAQFKIGLAFFTAFIAYFGVGTAAPVAMDSLYVLTVIREVLVGLCLGFIAYMFFTIVQIAGSFIDLQMGFGIANVIDPMTGAQSPILGNLKYIIALLLFLSFNGHHYLLEGIMRSYEWIPLDNNLFYLNNNGQLSDFMIRTFSSVFSISFQIAAPLVVALFLADVGLGLLARVSPQFNIFVIGLPLKILLGFVMLLLLFPGYETVYKDMFASMLDAIRDFFGLFNE